MPKATHSLSPSVPLLKVGQLGEHFDGFATSSRMTAIQG